MKTKVELQTRHSRRSARLGAALLLLLVTACIIGTPVNPPATEVPAEDVATDTKEQPVPTTAQPEEETPTEEPVQTQEPTSMGYLSGSGPWLLVQTEQGLLAFNPDGSGRTVVINQSILAPGPLQKAVSPLGDKIAVITSTNPDSFFFNLTLQMISFPSAIPLFTRKLTSPDTEPTSDLQPGTNQIEINRALTEFPSFAWAPYGLRLAFIGAFEGPSADVYTYLMADGTLERHTDGPAQAYRPFWSPEGRYLIQTAADTFGTGAGYSVTGIYATRVNEGGNFPLYSIPAQSGDELGLGWLDPETLVVESWFGGCGFSDLRIMNLTTRKITMLKKDCVTAAAVASSGGTVVFSTGNEVYKATVGLPASVKISSEDIQEIRWSPESKMFFAQSTNGTILEIALTGKTQTTPSKGFPIVSPDGRYWAWIPVYLSDTETGVWAGEYGLVQSRVFPGEVPAWNGIAQLIWAQDSQSFYFVDSQGDLYRTWVSTWSPERIATGLELSRLDLSLAWAW